MSRGWAWGIDTGALRAGLGVVELGTGAHQTNAWGWREKSMDLPRSLLACYQHTLRFAGRMASTFPPVTIAVEKAIGQHPNPSLVMHGGIITMAVYQATGLSPWQNSIDGWKRDVSGNPKMRKDELPAWARDDAHLGALPLMPNDLDPDFDQLAGLAIAASAAHQFGLDLRLLHPKVSHESRGTRLPRPPL